MQAEDLNWWRGRESIQRSNPASVFSEVNDGPSKARVGKFSEIV